MWIKLKYKIYDMSAEILLRPLFLDIVLLTSSCCVVYDYIKVGRTT
jgi:hypothetical protein